MQTRSPSTMAQPALWVIGETTGRPFLQRVVVADVSHLSPKETFGPSSRDKVCMVMLPLKSFCCVALLWTPRPPPSPTASDANAKWAGMSM